MTFPIRFRRLFFILLSAVLLASAVDKATAHNLNLATATSTSIDTDVHWWNDAAVETWNGYQYTAYWDAIDTTDGKVYLAVARRNTSTNAVTVIRFNSTNGNQSLIKTTDGHNYVNMALSRVDGRIHISWANHIPPNGEKHNYGLSSSGCLSQATFTNCTFSFTDTGHSGGASQQGRLTYPIYFTDRQNNLYFFFRCGESERGNEFMHIYNNNGTWTNRGLIIEGRALVDTNSPPDGVPNPDSCNGGGPGSNSVGSYDVDGAGGYAAQTIRGVYMYGVAFDKNDRLHISWGWREYNTGIQHHLYYAYSDDSLANIGTTWKDAGGTQQGTAGGTDPLHVQDSTLAVPGALEYPNGGSTANINMKLDSRNQPHWIMAAYDNAAGAMYNQHIWRTAGTNGSNGAWYLQYITPANENTGSSSSFAFDGSDNIYHIGQQNFHEWAPYNAGYVVYAELAPDHVTWQGGDYLEIVPMSSTTELQTLAVNVPIGLGTNANKQFRVRMKNTTPATQVNFWWNTTTNPSWSTQSFTVTGNDTVYKDYTFTITNAGWTGTMKDLEFDPVGSSGVIGNSVSIDYIRITNSAGTVAKAWEFQKGVRVVGAVGMSANNWASWETGIDLFSGLSDAASEWGWRLDRQRYVDAGLLSFPLTEQGTPLQEKLTIKEIDISGDDEIIEWDFDVDRIGWTDVNNVTGFGWAFDGGGGTIGGTLSGNDPYIRSMNNLRTKIGSANYIHISLKNSTAANTAKVYFITEADGAFNETKVKSFTITPNSNYTWYHINMSAVSGWTGQTLQQLRIDPTDVAGVSTGSFKIDKVSINASSTTP